MDRQICKAVVDHSDPVKCKAVLSSLIGFMSDYEMKLIASKILDVYEQKEFPMFSDIEKDAIILEYNPWDNQVKYSYTKEVIKYFKSEEDAQTPRDSLYSTTKTEKYSVEVKILESYTGYCSPERWIKHGKK